MALNTQQKLQKMLEKHTEYRIDVVASLTKAEQKLREAIQVKSFGENDIIKKIRNQYAKDIKDMNEIILYKEKLSEEDRTRLFDKRKMYLSFLQLFSRAEVSIESIDKWITTDFDEEG